MKVKIKEAVELEEGKHEGLITRVEFRNVDWKGKQFNYTDVYIKPDGQDFEVKYGAPTNGSLNSKLGKLLSEFTELKVGVEVDPKEILLNKRVSFITVNEEKEGTVYSKVISLKPEKIKADTL